LHRTEADCAQALIRYARQDGLALSMKSGRLIIGDGDKRDEDLIGELIRHEAAVLACLMSRPAK
jgi:hypothetical protein